MDAGVCIEADDRAALEWLLRYCARPPFAMDRLRKEGSALVYRCAKQHSEPTSDRRGAKVDELHLKPLELIERIAARVPPPRRHRHRYLVCWHRALRSGLRRWLLPHRRNRRRRRPIQPPRATARLRWYGRAMRCHSRPNPCHPNNHPDG